MREIKFQLVGRNITFKEIQKDIVTIQQLIDGNFNPSIIGSFFNTNNSNCELLAVRRYTGLKDKNDVEIYEGDILDLGENWWDASGFGGFDSNIQLVKWREDTCGFSPFSVYDSDCGVEQEPKLCEVIGNIYENPGLLKGDK